MHFVLLLLKYVVMKMFWSKQGVQPRCNREIAYVRRRSLSNLHTLSFESFFHQCKKSLSCMWEFNKEITKTYW